LKTFFRPCGPKSLPAQTPPHLPSKSGASNAPGSFPLTDPLEVASATDKSFSLSVAPKNEEGIILANPQAMSPQDSFSSMKTWRCLQTPLRGKGMMLVMIPLVLDDVSDTCNYAWVFLMIFGLKFGINLH